MRQVVKRCHLQIILSGEADRPLTSRLGEPHASDIAFVGKPCSYREAYNLLNLNEFYMGSAKVAKHVYMHAAITAFGNSYSSSVCRESARAHGHEYMPTQ